MKREKFQVGSTMGRLFNGKAFVVVKMPVTHNDTMVVRLMGRKNWASLRDVRIDRVFAY